jgi:tetratricopeptide (TPR) repeat protein
LEGNEKVLECEHPSTLTSINNLGNMHFGQGKYTLAEILLRQALEGCEEVLGREHPDMLNNVSNLANVLDNQGRYEAAEAMHQHALEAREKVLGCEHPSALSSINDLGNVISKQGKYEEVQAIYRRVQTVDSSTLMQQGILPKNIFSTPHPLLQLSQRHHRSLGEKNDRDVD